MLLSLASVSAGYYPGTPVLSDIDLAVSQGEFLGLIGPNGSGKSTLLRVIAGVLAVQTGCIRLDGRELSQISRRQLARSLAVVPQETASMFGFSVREVVAMGRHPFLGPLGGLSSEDVGVISEALRLTDTAGLTERSILELSGGERQRVIVARALAQRPRLLLLDEPTNHLDINHQIEIFDLLRALNRKHGLTLMCITHDLNFAGEYCDRIVLVHDGRIRRDGG
ncbi:MAG: ABC transporter ATP-binding protein, partial [Candidatus Latescibacterota bacterium]|nr:ABC transporter ATP-binding protein [Candidatus Latescibacterota bacterium]